MEKFGKSQSVSRTEDHRFLTGKGQYVDDIAPDGALFAFVFRSPVAHGDITELDVADARASAGVKAVITAEDLRAAGIVAGMDAAVLENQDGTKAAAPRRPLLAEDRVRFLGEAVAVVIAETLAQASDAAELIGFDYQELDTHLALQEGGPLIHEEAPLNRAFDWCAGDQLATSKAFDKAAHHIRLSIADNRIIACSLEPRGCFAEWKDGRLHLCVNGQGVWGTKSRLAKILNLPDAEIRVTNPDVGGGFGMKAMDYPETFICAHAARQLGRPVRWMSERSEAMVSDNSGRDLVSIGELAFDVDHKIIGYWVSTLCNLGAYNSQYAQPIQTELFAKVLTGPYDIPTAFLSVKGIYTNTTQVDAFRGAGRPEAIYVLERVMDRAARALKIDGWELRRKNFIAPDAFPYQTVTGALYDVGDFSNVLTSAEQAADRRGFSVRKSNSQAKGRLRGLGLCYYIESILGDPSETAKVLFQSDGTVEILVGTQSNGQGHETAFAQFLADQTGIPAHLIKVIQGDSDRIAKGGGTGGSRSATAQNNATLAAVTTMIEAFSNYLADKSGVEPHEITFDDEQFRVAGSNLTPTMLELAKMARIDGRDDLLSHQATAKLNAQSFPNGAHVAEVEVDPDTGQVELISYVVVDDFGHMLNPMLVEGQVHGGVTQGVGQALCEHVVYDADGQLLTGSLMDYALPRARDVPFFQFKTQPLPSTANVLGIKGCGEAGTVGALAAVANAVQDALWDQGVTQADMPFTPLRIWTLLNTHDLAAE
ncbi:MAG: xanthine dehydrogenase family protein molybdopterin-binding subunit [Paracoccaceae bacterium]|nr:xanthine dehydrogenase family protein molybdopterin-binding subunit [Paracoccaceae bacterium]